MTEPARDELWLWCDVETTGLRRSQPAVLEAACMVTTADLVQLTPLRSWLTSITYPDHPPLTQWPDWLGQTCPEVAKLHADSGLRADWINAPAAALVTDIRDLDDLIRAELDDAIAQLKTQGGTSLRVHLAGGGVAQYEANLFEDLHSKIPGWCHYRTADTSVTAMVMRKPKVAWVDPSDGLRLAISPFSAAATRQHRGAADLRAAYATVRRLRGQPA